jgi:hypothetical protein
MLDAWNWVAMATAMAQMMGQPTADQTPAAPKTPRKLADGLTGHLGLPLHKAVRVKAVAHWPIGFTRRDLTHWGLLSEKNLRRCGDTSRANMDSTRQGPCTPCHSR